MKIKRYLVDSLRMVRDDDVDRTAIVIDLTEEELLKAYREQERIFQLNDAYNQLCDYLGFVVDNTEPSAEDKAAIQQFTFEYGFNPSWLVNKDSPYYALERIVDKFNHYHDCNLDENSLYQSICEQVLDELREVS